MSKTLLADLGQRLDEQSSELSRLDAYYAGRQPLAFLSPEAKTALDSRLTRLAVNVPRLVVHSLAERLEVIGFRRAGQPDDDVFRSWEAAGMGQSQAMAHREALTLGRSFVIVWTGPNGSPRPTVESAHQVAAERDPASRQVLAALKRWSVPDPTRPGAPVRHVAVTYEPDVIRRYETRAGSPPTDAGAWSLTDTVANPLGVVPVVPIVNTDRLLEVEGRSEMADVLDLTDALVKLAADMMVTSEFFSRPRRWATGIEIPVDDDGNAVNPFASEVDRTWISEAAESKFGQFQATDLAAYDTAVKVVMQQISAVSSLPEHYLGITTDNPASADAIRSAEASLTARAMARQAAFAGPWSRVADLMTAVATGAFPAEPTEVVWRSAESRTPAQTADAVAKLVQAGILPVSEALAELGYGPDRIGEIRAARRGDAADTLMSRVGSLQ